MKMCSKCKKRPAVVFVSDMSNPNAEPNGLCLVCAKEMGLKPVEDMLKRMNISDEDIEQMSEQFMDIMALNEENDDAELNDETFDLGTAPAMPFLNKIFGNMGGNTEKAETKEKEDKKPEKDKKKRRRFIEQYCTNLTDKAKQGQIDVIIGRDKELYRTIQILSRRSKNNPCLIGEPGVGKTAIAEGL
ncbi:MAG: ATP-dependent Clp protease ATP-binding subunit, partial [Clostridia bacterium]|nr:ATP-dependent Clp protease ATP-binding subunit [Clostridia bacterium]